MQHNTPYAPALSRTFAARTVYRECGVIVDIEDRAVTIWKTGEEYRASVDGEEVTVQEAGCILRAADRVTMTGEVLVSEGAAA